MLSNRKRCKNQSSLHGFFRKLPSKNVKKSAKDYFIYFFTHYNCSSFLLEMLICAAEIATITMKKITALAL